jgi:Cell division protein CrgA
MAKQKNSKTVGRYVSPEARGRITPKKQRETQESHEQFGWLILQLMAFGIIVITLNYLAVLPGSVSSWYLVIGLISLFTGFYLSTKYK